MKESQATEQNDWREVGNKRPFTNSWDSDVVPIVYGEWMQKEIFLYSFHADFKLLNFKRFCINECLCFWPKKLRYLIGSSRSIRYRRKSIIIYAQTTDKINEWMIEWPMVDSWGLTFDCLFCSFSSPFEVII